MLNWSILIVVLSLALGIVALGIRWRRKRSHDGTRDPVSAEHLHSLGDALGLETYREVTLFGESIQILRGEFHNLFVELEVSRGDWDPYVRIAIEFPSHLGQNISVCKDDHESLLNYLRRIREIEIDEEEFDPKFLLFARDPERLERLLTEAAQFQLIRLAEGAERVRLTDDGLFLFMSRVCTPEEISSKFRKAIELAERVYRTAYILGAGESSSEPSQYGRDPLDSIREAAGIEGEPREERTTRRREER